MIKTPLTDLLSFFGSAVLYNGRDYFFFVVERPKIVSQMVFLEKRTNTTVFFFFIKHKNAFLSILEYSHFFQRRRTRSCAPFVSAVRRVAQFMAPSLPLFERIASRGPRYAIAHLSDRTIAHFFSHCLIGQADFFSLPFLWCSGKKEYTVCPPTSQKPSSATVNHLSSFSRSKLEPTLLNVKLKMNGLSA